ncbi:polysaccharide deacetylase family protein [Priestia endophytica]|uniref:polysaccharide deacetylase family protein n=1 Tax=Priestia endophytica TaxID=135735 RepID=UPI00203E0284|nr:polysaccharide deacetylase family protein [Priestia endophytica]MCM3540278.1 polysaccharide deacetylase family protein [Priestia endophytica]
MKKKITIVVALVVLITAAVSSLFIISFTKKADMIPVLTYHRLLLEGENKLYKNQPDVLSVEAFEKQMKWLHDNGYHTMTIHELDQFLNEKKEFPAKTVMIQFDDGRRDVKHYAYSILKKYDLHAIENIITSRTNRNDGPWDPDKHQFMKMNDIKDTLGVFELGAHTDNLHNLGEDGKGDMLKKSDEEILKDLKLNRNLLNQTELFVYPFGHYTSHTADLVKEAGFKYAFTTKTGYVSQNDDPYQLARQGIGPKVTIKDFENISEVNSFKNKAKRFVKHITN